MNIIKSLFLTLLAFVLVFICWNLDINYYCNITTIYALGVILIVKILNNVEGVEE